MFPLCGFRIKDLPLYSEQSVVHHELTPIQIRETEEKPIEKPKPALNDLEKERKVKSVCG